MSYYCQLSTNGEQSADGQPLGLLVRICYRNFNPLSRFDTYPRPSGASA
jgi:hypothetical protein